MSSSASFMMICDSSCGLSSTGRPDPEQQTATAGRAGQSDLTHQMATTSPSVRKCHYLSHNTRPEALISLRQHFKSERDNVKHLNITHRIIVECSKFIMCTLFLKVAVKVKCEILDQWHKYGLTTHLYFCCKEIKTKYPIYRHCNLWLVTSFWVSY